MAFANEVGVAEIRIRVGDAGPGIAVPKLRFGNEPEGVALADGVLRGSARRSDRSRNDNLRAYLEEIRIAKTGIERQQFLPAASVAKPCGGKLPERIAGLDSDDGESSGNCRQRCDARRR